MAINTKYNTFGEELANAISHVTGAALSVIGLILLIIKASKSNEALALTSAIIFGISMLIMYTFSGLMHWLPVGKGKNLFRKFDQIGIFLLIAGTYTPFALVAIGGKIGWWIFGIEWTLAIAGILYRSITKADAEEKVKSFYLITYVLMGWLIVIAIKTLYAAIGLWGFVFLILGGLFYTGGIVFFRMHNVKYHHLVWHIFVIFGTIMHFFAIYFYVLK
jgi:hemolysin III